MRMAGAEALGGGALRLAEAEADSGTAEEGLGVEMQEGEGGEAGSSGSNGETSPLANHALNTNYDSSDGAIPVHRCDKCENYETLSRAALLAHSARCSSSNNDVDQDTGKRLDRKLFECDVCNMKFSNGANMRRHKMRHTGVKPYECRVCQKRFFRKDHLAEHFTTHTKTLPYHCPICNRGFQRQIAMRAHFQNEHVGQHDMIKSCPLCSFRAGTMKSLRVHFFNRHGIDLDNPGSGPCSGPLSLDTHNNNNTTSNLSAQLSDSGDSQGDRSLDNATPPMHFLTPHVEISMTDASPYSPRQMEQTEGHASDLSSSPNSGDSNTPTSTHPHPDPPDSQHAPHSVTTSGPPNTGSSHSSSSNSPASPGTTPLSLQCLTTMPCLSVIPIVKQERSESDDGYNGDKSMRQSNGPVNLSKSTSPSPQNPTSTMSLIKVSPLKSLLRDDLKRKLSTRASLRIRPSLTPLPLSPAPSNGVNGPSPNHVSNNPSNPSNGISLNGLSAEEREKHLLGLQNLQCVFCGIWFPDQTLYFLHKGCHCESNPWKCNICGEQCGNVYQFNSHLLSNTHQ